MPILLYSNFRQNIWNKMKKSSEIRQGKKALISAFDLFLTAITKVSFLEGILGTVLSLHDNLRFF